MNLFRGRVVFDQAFPYPLNLNEDQRETLNMVMGPVKQYLEEVNDPFKNDETASIPMEQLKKFADLGAFGALVPEKYEGGNMNNSQLGRIAEEIGKHDLGLGVVLGKKFINFC
jgi:alkylation response protein AidB-like acyl-CoA dehydrogenase